MAKSLSAFLFAKWRPLCSQSSSSYFPYWRAKAYRASLIMTAVVVLFNYLCSSSCWPSIMPLTTSIWPNSLSVDKAKGKRLTGGSSRIDQFCFTCRISCWVDYLQENPALLALLGASLVLCLVFAYQVKNVRCRTNIADMTLKRSWVYLSRFFVTTG